MKYIFMTLCAGAALLGGAGCADEQPVTHTETTTTTEEHVIHPAATTTETQTIQRY